MSKGYSEQRNFFSVNINFFSNSIIIDRETNPISIPLRQAVGSSCMVDKNVSRHGWPTTKNLKLHQLKCPKTVPKNGVWNRK